MVFEEISRNAGLTVGTTPIIAAQTLFIGQRAVIVITNTSTGGQIITIQVGQQAANDNAGIVLYPSGSWSESIDSGFLPQNADYWVRSSAAGGAIAIHERVRVNKGA